MGKTTLLLAQSLSFVLDLADWFLVIERKRIVHGAP